MLSDVESKQMINSLILLFDNETEFINLYNTNKHTFDDSFRKKLLIAMRRNFRFNHDSYNEDGISLFRTYIYTIIEDEVDANFEFKMYIEYEKSRCLTMDVRYPKVLEFLNETDKLEHKILINIRLLQYQLFLFNIDKIKEHQNTVKGLLAQRDPSVRTDHDEYLEQLFVTLADFVVLIMDEEEFKSYYNTNKHVLDEYMKYKLLNIIVTRFRHDPAFNDDILKEYIALILGEEAVEFTYAVYLEKNVFRSQASHKIDERIAKFEALLDGEENHDRLRRLHLELMDLNQIAGNIDKVTDHALQFNQLMMEREQYGSMFSYENVYGINNDDNDSTWKEHLYSLGNNQIVSDAYNLA